MLVDGVKRVTHLVMPLVAQVMDQTDRRVVQEETVPPTKSSYRSSRRMWI
jgi:hypothetical protein